MENTNLTEKVTIVPVVKEIRSILDTARSNVAQQVNSELLNTYWNIGRISCEHEQSMPERADYGKQTLKELSKALTKEFGKGFSPSNLQNMRQFYLTYEKCQTLSGKLSWSHKNELHLPMLNSLYRGRVPMHHSCGEPAPLARSVRTITPV